jgi:5'-nucleotidase (lipoprotein e(P4) family)
MIGRGLALAIVLLAGTASAQPAPRSPPPAMQWMYGSGESAASSIQAYHAFRNYVVATARRRPVYSVVLAPGATLAAPRFLPCGRRPLAVVLDVDETALQNLGHGYDEAVRGRVYNQEIWNRYEETGQRAVLPMPGAVAALAAIRRAGVTVIFNSNRLSRYAAQTRAAIEGAGLGPAVHRRTLWLKGDIGTSSNKDPRRAEISRRYCVIAMAGDQLGDFSELFNADGVGVRPRRVAAGGAYARMWGNGWFMLSNPVYGPGLRGTFDDVFPADRRWSDPQGGND